MTLFSRNTKRRRTNSRIEPSVWRQIIIGGALITGVILFGVLTWYVTRLEAFTIQDIEVQGGETISHDVVRTRVEDVLRGSYFRIIPFRFTLFYPHDAILASLSEIPRIHGIEITEPDRRHVLVTFSEYVPDSLWCESVEEDAPCMFVNAEGYAFSGAPSLQGGSFVRHVVEGDTEFKSKQILEAEFLKKLHAFVALLEDELGLRVAHIVHTKEGDINLMLHGGGKILAATDQDFESTFKNIQSVLLSSEFKHLRPGNFNYIDVRFGNKVFVNEEFPSAATTTEAVSTTTPL